jgi:hypothetical protein
MPKALLADASVSANGLRALYFVCDSALILASLFKNLCVKTPKGLTLFKCAELGLQVSKQSSAQLISFFDFQFSNLIFSSAELRFGFHDKHALGGAAAQKRSVVKRNTRPRVKRSVTSGERPRNSKNKKAPHCCEAHLCFT